MIERLIEALDIYFARCVEISVMKKDVNLTPRYGGFFLSFKLVPTVGEELSGNVKSIPIFEEVLESLAHLEAVQLNADTSTEGTEQTFSDRLM